MLILSQVTTSESVVAVSVSGSWEGEGLLAGKLPGSAGYLWYHGQGEREGLRKWSVSAIPEQQWPETVSSHRTLSVCLRSTLGVWLAIFHIHPLTDSLKQHWLSITLYEEGFQRLGTERNPRYNQIGNLLNKGCAFMWHAELECTQ